MRFLPVCLVLFLTGCEQSFFMVGDKGREATIDRLSEARDRCLSRNASADITTDSDTATIARAIALACSAETEKLVVAINRDGDAKVTSAIRQSSEFRAMGYVLRARGQVIF
jgi:hypothetical protein